MKAVMVRRGVLSSLMVLLISAFAFSGLALAHKSAKTRPAGEEAAACSIVSLPSFVDQGEFKQAGSIADIIEVHCQSVYAEQYVKLSSAELSSRCQGGLKWEVAYSNTPAAEGSSISGVQLDDAGNATVAVFGGPSCASGESLISAHLEEAPYETFTTSFVVLPPHATPPGVQALPSSQVEDDITSSVATILEVEFPSVYAERYVNISAEQLHARCGLGPHLFWEGPEANGLGEGESQQVQLDNSGNAFVLVYGNVSCASGNSLIEANLTSAPYTTYTTEFTVKSPETPHVG
jgi:lambda repressor-like predicted transcriptional regulator